MSGFFSISEGAAFSDACAVVPLGTLAREISGALRASSFVSLASAVVGAIALLELLDRTAGGGTSIVAFRREPGSVLTSRIVVVASAAVETTATA